MSELSVGLYRVFQSIKEKNLSIIFDTSGSMYQYLDVVKTSIVKLAHYLSHTSNNSQFNVISFSKSNNSFAESVVPCTKENIFSASKWLEDLSCETQTNSLLALVSAFSDDNCDGVVIFTDGLPSQKSTVVLKCVEEISDGRPVHVIYVNNGFSDRNVVNFWEILTEKTYGTFHILSHTKKDEHFTVCSKGREDYDLQSQSELSSDCSTNVGYGFNERLEKLKLRSRLNNGIKKFVGKTVLVKSKEDGIFYKGNIIEERSQGAVVYFQPNEHCNSGTKDYFSQEDIIFFDVDNLEKVYEQDSVLVNVSGNKFIPGLVLKKEYIYDEKDDSLDFVKMLSIKTYEERTEIVPIASALRITDENYKRFVRGILLKQIDKADENIGKLEESKCQLFRTKSYDPDDLSSPQKFEEERDYLKEKIEQQLAESAQFMKNLTIDRDYEEFIEYPPPTVPTSPRMRRDRLAQSLSLPRRKDYTPSGDSSILLTRSYTNIKPPKPPRFKSWSNENEQKKSRRHIRSASVGSNVVEQSKKHWAGRPITREMTPKRPLNERHDRYRLIKSKSSPPVAEEYQTADGVPLPLKTDNKLRNWASAHNPVPPYLHRDIIGHRIVNVSEKPFNERIGHTDKKAEIRENNRLIAMKASQERRKEKEADKKKQNSKEKKERDEQAREQHRQKKEEGYTKIQITIEKDRSILENKQRKLDYWRNFEGQRERQNQQKKYDRVDAMKEKKTNYPQLKEDNARQMAQNRKEEKQKVFEQTRLEKEIDKHEAKLERLKKIRKATDHRFDSLRKKNDYQRDITEHVRNLNTGRMRSEILP